LGGYKNNSYLFMFGRNCIHWGYGNHFVGSDRAQKYLGVKLVIMLDTKENATCLLDRVS
jgi:hypothetical protein